MHGQQNIKKNVEECNKCIKMKNLCVKLVKKHYHYNRMHGQQNVKTRKYEVLLLNLSCTEV